MRRAFRILSRSRWYSLTSIAVIALNVAFAATVLAAVDGSLFLPLPYPQSTRLSAVLTGFAALPDTFGYRLVRCSSMAERPSPWSARCLTCGSSIKRWRFAAWLFISFAVVALVTVGASVLTIVAMTTSWQTPTDDPLAWGIAVGLLLSMIVLGTAAPALRASRVDPVKALREDYGANAAVREVR
jgi:hypothetical protein